MKAELTLEDIKALIESNPDNTTAAIKLLLDALDDAAVQILRLQEKVESLENRLKYTKLGLGRK